jgi:uncharacterized protein YdaU (DUF1376 family)
MALRDQPYIPLYVQDFLTDEKLMECSASATGIYIRIMCVMHKSDEYGTILLKQKDKQSSKPVENFALKLAKYLPYSSEEIISGLSELISEDVIKIDGDKLSQKRMVKDNAISIVRANAGKKGGIKTQFAKANPKAKDKAKLQANSEYVIENESDFDIVVIGEIEEYWEKWKNYLIQQHNVTYNGNISEEEAKKELIKLAEGDATKAMGIIDHCISKRWKNFYTSNNKSHGRSEKSTLEANLRAAGEGYGVNS